MQNYLFEFVFTFFQMVIIEQAQIEYNLLGITSIMISVLTFSSFVEFIPNFSLAVSFLVTGYKPFLQIVIVLVMKVSAAIAAMAFNSIMGVPKTKFQANNFTLGHIFVLEFVFNFFIALAYYCNNVDLRNPSKKELAFRNAFIGGLGSIVLPGLPIGRIMQVLATLTTNVNVLFGSVLGGIMGSIMGGVLYKFVICENHTSAIKQMEHMRKEEKVQF